MGSLKSYTYFLFMRYTLLWVLHAVDAYHFFIYSMDVSPSLTTLEIKETRKKMVLSKILSFDKLPSTINVMYYQILRCIFQCIISTKLITQITQYPPVQSFKWKFISGTLFFFWLTLPGVAKGFLDAFLGCDCKRSTCTKICSCKDTGEPWTTLCAFICYN